jgi:hypothetical protein
LGKRITPKDRKKIEAAIALKVPRRARRNQLKSWKGAAGGDALNSPPRTF